MKSFVAKSPLTQTQTQSQCGLFECMQQDIEKVDDNFYNWAHVPHLRGIIIVRLLTLALKRRLLELLTIFLKLCMLRTKPNGSLGRSTTCFNYFSRLCLKKWNWRGYTESDEGTQNLTSAQPFWHSLSLQYQLWHYVKVKGIPRGESLL